MENYILQMKDITKIYPNGFVANKAVNLEIRAGEIHALVGENGAGKTTLMKILFGLEDHQEGKILIKGQEVKINNPLHAIACGVGMVHQHFMQVPKFTIAENIVLGIEPTRGVVFDKREAIKIARNVAEKFQFDIDVTEVIEDISVGKKQKVELLKALVRGVDILILDEPTAVLTPQETTELFQQLRRLKEMGISIVFISHKLEEIVELCDRVTVLRHGYSVGSEDIANVTRQKLAEMMIGRKVSTKIEKEQLKPGKKVVEVDRLVYVDNEGRRVLNNISFSVREGEVVGIAGIEGNGQSELCSILSGMLPVLGGSIKVNGTEIRGKSIHDIRALGVSHISEDRMKYGCAPSLSVKDNIMADRFRSPQYRKLGLFIDHKKANAFVDECIREYEILCDDRTSPVKLLSGGNIQKVVVAREFTSGANVIIANQPTRGIDVGTSEMIRKTIIKKAREDKVATVLVSSDFGELLELSDRLIVLYKGRIVAHWANASGVTEIMLGEYMLGVNKMTREEMGINI